MAVTATVINTRVTTVNETLYEAQRTINEIKNQFNKTEYFNNLTADAIKHEKQTK